MKDHPDTTYAKTLAGILRKGAKIGYRDPFLNHRNQNHLSALSTPDLLTADLQKQLQYNRLTKIEPDSKAQFNYSPLRLVPKHNDDWRRIHDLSFPYDNSVNNDIPRDWGTLKYTTFDKTVDALLQQGPKALLIKRDLKNTFRHIPIALSN